MAKFPRSRRKQYQVQRGDGLVGVSGSDSYYLIPANYIVWGVTAPNRWGILAYAETKKLAREYIASKRHAIKNREW
jgi:hypothetical protein